jgi:hypothetical protein
MIMLGATFTLMNSIFTANAGMGDIISTQANVRVAMNTISRDITVAGTGLPSGSVVVPNGADAASIIRPGMNGFSSPERELETPGNVLPIVSTGAGDGPTVATDTDVLTIFTTNQESPTWNITDVDIFSDRYEVTFQQAVDADTHELFPGDLLLFSNNYGSILVCVTELDEDDEMKAVFSASDAMGINQPSAANGNLGGISNPGTSPATYPPTTAMRVNLITYFINNSNPAHPRLMRGLNAGAAQVIAEDIENFQISYDTWDEATATQNSNVKTTANPNQIRSVAVAVTGRSPEVMQRTSNFYRFSLVSKINVRNSTFRNRYAGS